MTTDTIEMQEIVVDGTTKYTIAFGLTDEDGKPLLDRSGKPRFTNLVADSPGELVKKLGQANLEVARALERSSRRFETLSTRQPTARTAPAEMKSKPLSADEVVQVGLDTQDPRKAADAIKRVVESVVPVKEITTEVQRQAHSIDLESRRNIAREFIAGHKDYLPIEANNAMLNRYLIENNLEFSVANLEFAAAVLAVKLVEPPRARENASAPSPDNASPDNAPPNRDTPPAPERRAPASGIRNSQVSDRPASSALVLTRQQALDMLYKEPRKYEAWMRDPQKNKILNAALASR
jgi:hypothetical protein